MDANFSLKRLARKEELVAYCVTEEERIWVEQNEVEEAGIEERLFKQAEKKVIFWHCTSFSLSYS